MEPTDAGAGPAVEQEHPLADDSGHGAGVEVIDSGGEAERVPASELQGFIDQLGDENLTGMMREAIRLENKYGYTHPRSIDALCQVAHACEDTAEYDVAIELHLAAAQGVVETDGVESELYASTLASLGELSRKLNRLEESEDYFQKAVQIQELVTGPEHPHLAFMFNSLAGVLTASGKFQEAKAQSDKALQIFNAELLASVMVRDLDSGSEVKLSEAEKFLPKGCNPIELHSIEEILATCMVKNLDSGDSATLIDADKLAPRPDDPLILRNYADALATMVIKNLDTGEASTLAAAETLTTFAPVVRMPAPAPDTGHDKKGWTGMKLKALMRRSSTRSESAPPKRSSRRGRRASSTAAVQEQGVTRVTVTKHGDRKLGLLFDVADPKTGAGVVVKGVKPDGLAAETRAFAPGQRVMSLNGKDTTRMTKKDLIETIKATGSKVEFGLRMPQRPATIAGSPRTPAQHVIRGGTARSNGPPQGNVGRPFSVESLKGRAVDSEPRKPPPPVDPKLIPKYEYKPPTNYVAEVFEGD